MHHDGARAAFDRDAIVLISRTLPIRPPVVMTSSLLERRQHLGVLLPRLGLRAQDQEVELPAMSSSWISSRLIPPF
jgi:hypothetical protein